jgi:hypothetical protein
MKCLLSAIACLLGVAQPRVAAACAGCRNPNLPITRLSTAQLMPGQVRGQVPFRVVRTSIHYSDLGGAPYQPLDPDVHHRNETLAGIANPWLLLR